MDNEDRQFKEDFEQNPYFFVESQLKNGSHKRYWCGVNRKAFLHWTSIQVLLDSSLSADEFRIKIKVYPDDHESRRKCSEHFCINYTKFIGPATLQTWSQQ